MNCALITISGYVQGVGYRKFVRKEASRLGLTGWVQNMPDGTVEVKVCGSKETVEKLIELCKKGPFLSEVKEVTVVWKEEEKIPEDFSVLHS